MLRREPTKITLTPEDIANFEARKAQKDQQRQLLERNAAMQAENTALNDPFAESGRKAESRSKDQRIGVGASRGR